MFALRIHTANFSAKIYEVAPTCKHADQFIPEVLKKCAVLCLFILSVQFYVHAQTLPVGTVALEDYYRRSQLSGKADTNVSFTVRPVFPVSVSNDKHTDVFYPDSNEQRYHLIHANDSWLSPDKKLKISLLPLSMQTQYNSSFPSGWNDGPMIPAKGLQTLVSAGIFMQYGRLTVQLRPEFVYAQNSDFATFNPNSLDYVFARYYNIYNNIDLPARFGTGAYTKIYWGQSSIRINSKSLSFGISTENLWWGPGIQNSLLMSNTAPGFPHFTFNTLRPLKTPIGSFEGQVIGGSPGGSGFAPLVPDHFSNGTDLYTPKPNYWRYVNGVIITWQPKWVPGLFLGFDHTSEYYIRNLNNVNDFLPLFSSNVSDSQSIRITSLFMRWLWTQEHAELYFEFGKYNNTQDFLQELLSPNDQRAYTFGIRKLLPFNASKDQNILLGIEVSQLQENSVTSIASGKEWYVSQVIRQGYTNQGQELGAGIGPGGNLQSLDVSWVKGLKKLGVQFQRYTHNNDLYYYTYASTMDYGRHWVDMSMAATGEWSYKNLIFNAKIQVIKSFNYEWYTPPAVPNILLYTNAYNLQMQAGITYRF
ncbi:MAG TPA: hypothetical protein VGM63_08310 [Mucilaginibacter sp.]